MNKKTKVRNDQGEHAPNFAVPNPNREMIARIEEKIALCKSKRAVAEVAGIPLSTLNDLLSGKSEPRYSVIAELARIFDTSIDWLVYGKEPVTPTVQSDFIAVPVLPEAVSAGGGSMAEANDRKTDKHVMMGWDFLRSLSINPQNAALLSVRGDSMEPTLSGGDLILADTGDANVSTGGIFVIAHNGEAMVKRLTRRSDGSIMVISDNKDLYPPEIITEANADSFRVIGRVRWHARTIR